MGTSLNVQVTGFVGSDPQVRGPLIGRRLDRLPVGLETLQPEQAVMVGRLFLGRDAEPFVAGVHREVPWDNGMDRRSRANH